MAGASIKNRDSDGIKMEETFCWDLANNARDHNYSRDADNSRGALTTRALARAGMKTASRITVNPPTVLTPHNKRSAC
jgi:hypothetical protein